MSGMSPQSAVGRQVAAALRAHAARHGVAAHVTAARSRPWESARFSGGRHRLAVACEAEAGHWFDRLAQADLPLGDRIIADLVVTSREPGGATIELLTVEP